MRQEFDKNCHRVCLNNPFFHVYGVVIGIMNGLGHGATLVLPAPHFSAEDTLKAVVKEKCDVIYGTPTSNIYCFGNELERNIQTASSVCGFDRNSAKIEYCSSQSQNCKHWWSNLVRNC